jgi:hypothetical protein
VVVKREDYEPQRAQRAQREYNEIEKMGKCGNSKLRRCKNSATDYTISTDNVR